MKSTFTFSECTVPCGLDGKESQSLSAILSRQPSTRLLQMTREPTGFSVLQECFSLLTFMNIELLLNKRALKNPTRCEIPHYSNVEVSLASVHPLSLEYIP